LGPFGAKGVGEAALIPTAPAILSAIRHATGAPITQVRATPEWVRAALLGLRLTTNALGQRAEQGVVERRLAAVLAPGVVGFARLIWVDEVSELKRLGNLDAARTHKRTRQWSNARLAGKLYDDGGRPYRTRLVPVVAPEVHRAGARVAG
jgi:hypothetical protein